MQKYDVITLVHEAEAHGVHDTTQERKRYVMCEVRSVGRTEFYTALNAGYEPQIVFVLALAEDYDDERLVIYHGKAYRVIRTYVTASDGIEITVRRDTERGQD